MNNSNLSIRLETENDRRAVETLIREAFWNVYRPGCTEHYVMHVLRDDPAFVRELDLVMELDGRLIGQNMFMRTYIQADDGRQIDVLTMGPIGISPDLQRQGYGDGTERGNLQYGWSGRRRSASEQCSLRAISASTATAALRMPLHSASVIMICRRTQMRRFSFAGS